MSILCSTDGTASAVALQAANCVARCTNMSVHHIPSQDVPLGHRLAADEVADAAEELAARLIVVAAEDATHLGKRAERLARRTGLPVLVIRDLEPFRAWAEVHRPLKILVAASRQDHAAMKWSCQFARSRQCDLVLVHLYWPLREAERLGLGFNRSYVEADPTITAMLERSFASELASFSCVPTRMRMEPHDGPIGDGLTELARQEAADLVVIGIRARENLSRFGSIARSILDGTRASLVCVPGAS